MVAVNQLLFPGVPVEGTECFERAILPKKALREKLDKVVEDDFSTSAISSAIKALKQESDNECCKAVSEVLQYMKKMPEIPDIYKTLIKELRKDSPISSWLQSYIQSDTQLFSSFLQQETKIFNSYEKTLKFTHAFPYIARILKSFLDHHSAQFLPQHLTKLFLSLLKLREQFDIKSEERAVKRTKPKQGHKPSTVEIYPNNPEHTLENTYAADFKQDKTEDQSCSKEYNSKSTITGGLTHITCEHGVVKGFTALHRGESALKVLAPALRRLPKRVQAEHRYFIYDNACQSHKSALRRFPHRVRNWTFLIDRTHWKNHTSCHSGYNMDEFPQLKNVNSQQAEQINRSLRSLSTVLAFYKWETYLRVLELFFVRRNLSLKK
jgi:hypothetical protein